MGKNRNWEFTDIEGKQPHFLGLQGVQSGLQRCVFLLGGKYCYVAYHAEFAGMREVGASIAERGVWASHRCHDELSQIQGLPTTHFSI